MSEQPTYEEFEQKIQLPGEELRNYKKTAEERIENEQEIISWMPK